MPNNNVMLSPPSPLAHNLSQHQSFPMSWLFEYSGLISFRFDWFDLAVQGTLKSLLQHRNSKASTLWRSAFSEPSLKASFKGFSGDSVVTNPLAMQETPGWEGLLEKGMATSPVFLPGESHGRRSLVGYSRWGGTESDTTERLSSSRSD